MWETPVAKELDTTLTACDGKPFYMWRAPGTYVFQLSNGRRTTAFTTFVETSRRDSPSGPICTEMAGWESGERTFGERLSEPPAAGSEVSMNCHDAPGAGRFPGYVLMRVIGVEK